MQQKHVYVLRKPHPHSSFTCNCCSEKEERVFLFLSPFSELFVHFLGSSAVVGNQDEADVLITSWVWCSVSPLSLQTTLRVLFLFVLEKSSPRTIHKTQGSQLLGYLTLPLRVFETMQHQDPLPGALSFSPQLCLPQSSGARVEGGIF